MDFNAIKHWMPTVNSKSLISGADAAAGLLKRLGYGVKGNDEAAATWQRVAGPMARFSRAGDLKRGTFVVIVAASAIVQELRYRETELLAAIRVEMPDAKIRQLRFQTGRVTQ